jgi:hypothetical protein
VLGFDRGIGFRGSGFRVWVEGFRAQAFRV